MSSLRIHNWDKWQSYRTDRGQPPWIKMHRELLRKTEWVALTDAQRGQLVSLWMLAADKNGQIPDDPRFLQKICCMDCEPDLNLFIELGFIDAKATPRRRQHTTSERRHDVAPETETEAEAETEERQRQNRAHEREFESEFSETFWPEYPHKVGKPKAFEAFVRARKTHSLSVIMHGLAEYIRTKPPDRQWLNPATFFNQERFLDEPAPVAHAPPMPSKEAHFRQSVQEVIEEVDNGNFQPGTSRRALRGSDSLNGAGELHAATPRHQDDAAASDENAYRRAKAGFDPDG